MKVLTVRNKSKYNKHAIHVLHDAVSDSTYEMRLPDITAVKTLKGYIYRSLNILKGLTLPLYDVYLVEDPGSVALKKLFHPKIKVIQYIDSSYYPSLTINVPKRNYPIIEKYLVKLIFPHLVDGCIVISDFTRNEAVKVLKCPSTVAMCSFVRESRYKTLLNLKPNLNTHNIVYIGNANKDNLKVDILIEAFKQVKKYYNDTELYILGSEHPKSLEKIEGIHIEGFTENIESYLKKCSLAVIPGYGQACYTAVLETLLAGIPTIISNQMGLVELVESIDKRFVRDITPTKFADGIIWYFNTPLKEKIKYSDKAKSIGKDFNEENKVKEFKEKFFELVEEL